MPEDPDRPAAATRLPLTCPRCGAPLPLPSADGFVTCDYCGVRTELPQSVPRVGAPEDAPFSLPLITPELESRDDEPRSDRPYYIVRVAIAVVILVVLFVGAAATESSSNSPDSQGSPVASCSVAIDASSNSGPAPFTATFSAVVTTPPGDIASEPMWQFGPFPSGFDLNYTYGNMVTHTWDTSGNYSVDVSVPDSTGQGCWSATSVSVT